MEDCNICLNIKDNLSKIKTLTCNHSFHSKCINEWFKMSMNKKKTCPICRSVYYGNIYSYIIDDCKEYILLDINKTPISFDGKLVSYKLISSYTTGILYTHIKNAYIYFPALLNEDTENGEVRKISFLYSGVTQYKKRFLYINIDDNILHTINNVCQIICNINNILLTPLKKPYIGNKIKVYTASPLLNIDGIKDCNIVISITIESLFKGGIYINNPRLYLTSIIV